MLLGYGVIVLIAGRLIHYQSGYQGIRIHKSKQSSRVFRGELVGYIVEEVYLGVLAIGGGLMLGREVP